MLLFARKKRDIKSYSERKRFLYGLFICYFVVIVGVTLLNRESYYTNNLNLHLFSTYKEAWYRFSIAEWSNIILNILMLIPFGLLLPVVFKLYNSFWKVSITGLFFSITIEIVQFISEKGIVEADDILNNTIGTMIGYGFYVLAVYITKRVKKQKVERLGICIVYQIPLFVMIFIFIGLFISYNEMEFGNLPEHYIHKQNMKNIYFYNNIYYESSEEVKPIYKTKIADVPETQELADSLFQKLGTNIDFSQNLFYENTVIFRSENNKYSLWIDFKGMALRFTDFSVENENVYTDYNEKEVLEILSQYGILVPEGSRFEVNEEGYFVITADMIATGNWLYNGVLVLKITKDKVIKEYRNNIVTYQLYGENKCISQQEAFENIQAGKFKIPSEEHLETISIEKVLMNYRLDTKGFYQPVYLFVVTELSDPIIIPALN